MDASSPMRAIEQVNTPVLVLHGQEDRRVPVTQGLGFYRGLRLLGKNAAMVIYPREPHRIAEYEHQLDIQRRVLAWYDAHRSEERRVGKEGVSTCRSRWWPYPSTKNTKIPTYKYNYK